MGVCFCSLELLPMVFSKYLYRICFWCIDNFVFNKKQFCNKNTSNGFFFLFYTVLCQWFSLCFNLCCAPLFTTSLLSELIHGEKCGHFIYIAFHLKYKVATIVTSILARKENLF